MKRSTPILLAAALSVAAVSVARADYIPIYGGPIGAPAGNTLDSVTVPVTGAAAGNGAISSGVTAGNGVGIGYMQYHTSSYIYGNGSFLWDSSGAVTTLGSLGSASGSPSSSVLAISSSGIAVGTSSESSSTSSSRAVYWAAGSSTPTQLGGLGVSAITPGQSTGSANAINSSGLIVGSANKFSEDGFTGYGLRAVYWAPGSTTATELGTLGLPGSGINTTIANGVNSSGTIIGSSNNYAGTGAGGTHAVRWDAGSTTATDLGVLNTQNGLSNGSGTSNAVAINSAGTIVGTSIRYDTSTGNSLGTRAVRWDAGSTTPTELQPLGIQTVTTSQKIGSTYYYTYAGTGTASVYGINSAGTTVGGSAQYNTDGTVNLGTRAVKWAAGSTAPTELANLGTNASGSTYSMAYSINSAGLIAGYAYLNGVTQHAVVWSADGSIIDLNSLIDPSSGWLLTSANSISDTNWVTGLGTYTSGGTSVSRAFLIQVPEPTSLALIGLPALAMLRRRKR